jgi:hypothetical protein
MAHAVPLCADPCDLSILYGVGSVLAFLIFPFTLHYMNPLNDVLIEKFKNQQDLHYADLPEKGKGMQTARVSFFLLVLVGLFANVWCRITTRSLTGDT